MFSRRRVFQNPRHLVALSAIAGIGLASLPASAFAQEKQHVSYKSLPENTKYTQQNIIDVGDVPGHQVRIFEIHRTFPADPPMINGLKLVEQWSRGASDLIDNNGTNTTYGVNLMENGDKFFTRTSLVAQSPAPGKLNFWSTGTVTGATGKLAGMRGLVRSTGSAEPKAGVNETKTEIDYWFEK
jgi:hypothetical protein